MTYLIIYLAGVLVVPLLFPPADPQELKDVAGTWLLSFLWPLFVLLIISICLLIGGLFTLLHTMYLVVALCQILTPK